MSRAWSWRGGCSFAGLGKQQEEGRPDAPRGTRPSEEEGPAQLSESENHDGKHDRTFAFAVKNKSTSSSEIFHFLMLER